MSAASFRIRLHLAVIVLAAVIVASAAFAFFGAMEIDKAALRSRNAQAVLAAHITISNSSYNLFKQMSDAALLNELVEDDWENRLGSIVRRDISNARRAITNEVREPSYSEDEHDELERLASIEREVDAIVMEYDRIQKRWANAPLIVRRRQIASLLDVRIDLTFNKLVTAAIAEERREVAEADSRLVALTQDIKNSAIAIALLAAPLIAFVIYYVNTTLLSSLRSLTLGAEAYARGEFDYLISPLASTEFESIRQRLARMALELAAGRKTLESANERLEKGVAEKTSELADANRRLEEVDAQRRSFFADVSHELRTPLTVIRGEAEIALRGGERRAVDYRETLGRIVEQSSQMGRLVEDLLFIARADAGEPRMEMRSVAVNALLAEALASYDALAASRGVRMRKIDTDEGAVVVGDRGRLAQVLGVLVDNSIRYSKIGGEIRMSVRVDGGKAVIAVEDDGIGIAPAEVDRVFERFYRTETAKAHSGGGVGLGLPVAKAIIEAHNGHIRLSASSTGGVRATVTLPVETKLRAIS